MRVKKYNYLIKLLCFVFVLSSLLISSDGCMSHQGERPSDYHLSRWCSENPDICWFVREIGQDILGLISLPYLLHTKNVIPRLTSPKSISELWGANTNNRSTGKDYTARR